jgi:PAS domain S-box-containing protein
VVLCHIRRQAEGRSLRLSEHAGPIAYTAIQHATGPNPAAFSADTETETGLRGTSVHSIAHGDNEQRPHVLHDPAAVDVAAQCDCTKVLGGLGRCRTVLAGLAEAECLAVLCTLATEHGVTVRRPPTTGDAALAAADDLDWAREFVSQVVLSDALMGAAMRLDESKKEIDTIAARLQRVACDGSEQLERSEARYEQLFQRAKEGIFVCDTSGRFLDVNPAAIELLGYSTAEALTAEHALGWLFADAVAWESFYTALLEHDVAQNVECELVRRDGAPVHVLVTASLVRDAGGVATGFEGIWYDVTERRRLHERLVEVQRLEAARQTVLTYSHEINQPLTALCDAAQELLERCDPDTPEAKIALAMSDQAAKLAEVMLKIGRLGEIRPDSGDPDSADG